MSTIEDQPPPTPSHRPAVWDLVLEDMRQRDATGRERYGTPLQPFNGRDALVDLYQELLDAVVYVRQELEERRELRATLGRLVDASAALLRVLGEPEDVRHEALMELAGAMRAALTVLKKPSP